MNSASLPRTPTEAEWARRRRLRRARGRIHPWRLLGRPAPRRGRWPFPDHAVLWRTRFECVVISHQPYGTGDLREWLELAADLDLRVRVSLRDSWHAPGETLLVETWALALWPYADESPRVVPIWQLASDVAADISYGAALRDLRAVAMVAQVLEVISAMPRPPKELELLPEVAGQLRRALDGSNLDSVRNTATVLTAALGNHGEVRHGR